MKTHNHCVGVFSDEKFARSLANAINAYGMWDAVVWNSREQLDRWQVILPGTCIEGTEEYMKGFLEGFAFAKDVRVMDV